MDPITGAVVAIVLWFVFISVGATILFWGSTLIGTLLGGEDTGGPIGAIIGWFLALGWGIFALIQFISQIVHLIQLIA